MFLGGNSYVFGIFFAYSIDGLFRLNICSFLAINFEFKMTLWELCPKTLGFGGTILVSIFLFVFTGDKKLYFFYGLIDSILKS